LSPFLSKLVDKYVKPAVTPAFKLLALTEADEPSVSRNPVTACILVLTSVMESATTPESPRNNRMNGDPLYEPRAIKPNIHIYTLLFYDNKGLPNAGGD
jgi:hypothetical protein